MSEQVVEVYQGGQLVVEVYESSVREVVEVIVPATETVEVSTVGGVEVVEVITTSEVTVVEVVVPGPQGVPGAGADPFAYQMPAPATTATITHNLGRDPVAVQVIDGGRLCSEYGFFITVPGAEVQIGFDVSIAALIRLL